MTILVSGGQVLNRSYTALERADMLIESDRISAVGLVASWRFRPRHTVSMPPGVSSGLVNAPTHAHNNWLKGMANNWTLEELLNHAPALNSNRTPHA